jgi:hypothetical protein
MILEPPARSLATTRTELSKLLYTFFFDTINNKKHNTAMHNFTTKHFKIQSVSILSESPSGRKHQTISPHRHSRDQIHQILIDQQTAHNKY